MLAALAQAGSPLLPITDNHHLSLDARFTQRSSAPAAQSDDEGMRTVKSAMALFCLHVAESPDDQAEPPALVRLEGCDR